MGELSTLCQSEARFTELGEYSQNMLSEAFCTPNIASSQFDEYPELGSHSKSFTQLRTNYVRFDEYPETTVCPVKNGL